MARAESEVKQSISVDIGEDGTAATHPIVVDFARRVATSLEEDKTRNTIKDFLIVVGCTTVPDAHFDFDSSFVRPEAKDQFIKLAKLRDDLAENIGPPTDANPTARATVLPPLSVFGHADPVGEIEYNSTLSRRRARAVYAMLIRDAKEWLDLWNGGFGGDKWGDKQANLMQTTTARPLASSASLGQAARLGLIKAYMDAVCVRRDKDGTEQKFVLDAKKDFLARGAGTNAKADVQGCSEFNPAILLSGRETKEFKDNNDKEGRDAANAPNRRVIAFLFKPGSKVDPKKWPCPNAKDNNAVAACRKRLWSDSDRRLKPDPDLEREFRKTGDTFGCRFYHGIAQNSPCEKAQKLWVFRILLSPPRTQTKKNSTEKRQVARPLANRRFVLLAGDASGAPQIRGSTNDDGVIRVPVFDEKTTMKLKLDLGNFLLPEGLDVSKDDKPRDESTFSVFTLLAGDMLELVPDDTRNEDEGPVKQRLLNLGYGEPNIADWNRTVLKRAVRAFQVHHQISPSVGVLDRDTRVKIKEIHDTLPASVVTDPNAP
jgi:Putative peptidoglycan binding domain